VSNRFFVKSVAVKESQILTIKGFSNKLNKIQNNSWSWLKNLLYKIRSDQCTHFTTPF